LLVDGVTNPAAGTTIAGFIVTAEYNSETIASTDTGSNINRVITPKPAPTTIVGTLAVNPVNEAENSFHVFKFYPTTPLEITNDMIIIISFPDSYDDLVGYDKGCEYIGNNNYKL